MTKDALKVGNLKQVSKGLLNPYLHYSALLTPLQYMYHIFENIMENGAFALLEQMLHFP